MEPTVLNQERSILNRRRNGLPIKGTDVVAADLIALVSGVNFNTIVKVLTAINAIAKAKDIPVESLVEYDAIPFAAADINRRDATDQYALALSRNPAMLEDEDLLHFVSRITNRRS